LRHSIGNPRAAFAVFALFSLVGGAADYTLAEVHLTATEGDNGDDFAASITELGDLDGDGRWELLVGAPADQTAGLDAGAVFLWFGAPELTVAADRTWQGSSPERFGHAVARIGDVNGDGKEDWAVGAPGSNAAGLGAGRVYVFFGRAVPAAAADVVIDGAVGGDQFGYAVSAAGDFDGDGYDDFIVGAPFSNLRAQDAGAAYVIYGGSGGPSANLTQATVLTGQVADDRFGWSVTDAGNFLGGNEDCVAVGAPLSNLYGGLDAGAFYVYEGRLAGAAPDTMIDFAAGIGAAAKAGSRFGFAVRGIDSWDGDGFTDIAVGAPYCNESALDAGRVEIFRGGSSPSTTAYRYVNGAASTDLFGFALARVRQVSGSSLPDLLIGAPYHDSTATDGGRAYIYEGGRSSYSSAASLIAIPAVPLQPGTVAGDAFGYAVSSAGDFDGDGSWDHAVGAPGGNNLNGATAGYCLLVDTTGGVVANLLSLWECGPSPDGGARLRFRLGLPADEVAALLLTRRSGADRTVLWDGPAAPYCPGDGCLEFTGDGYRYDDAEDFPAGETVAYDLTLTLAGGGRVALEDLAGVSAGDPADLPSRLTLGGVWPNPANPMVSVRYRAPAGRTVAVRIFDMRGRQIGELAGPAATGDWQTATWDGRTADGNQAASGTYFIMVTSGDDIQARRVVLAR